MRPFSANQPTKPRAYSYVRFSTPEQSEGTSLERQSSRSKAFAERNGLHFDEKLTFKDLGVSGFKGKNVTEGRLGDFLNAVETGQVAAGSWLLVEALDRITRTGPADAIPLLMQITNAGITIAFLMKDRIINREILQKNPFVFFEILTDSILANQESTQKSDRVAKAWAQKRAIAQKKCAPLTKICPAWLRLQKQDAGDKPSEGFYVVIPERAAIVRQIFAWAADGWGKRSIALKLTSQGVQPWGYKKTKPNDRSEDGSKPPRVRCDAWHDSYVLKITNNPAVLGIFQPHKTDPDTRKRVPDGDPIEGYFPSIITPEEWHAAHKRPSAPRGPRPIRINNLFSGLVYDGYTGAVMRYTDKSSAKQARNRGDQRFLRSDIERRKPGTKGQTWPYWHFEATVLKYLRGLDWSSLIESGDDPQRCELQAEQACLTQEAEKDRAAITRLLDSFVAADQPEALAKAAQARAAELATRLEATEARLKDVQAELAALTSDASALTDGIEDFKRLITEGTPNERLRLQIEIRRRVKAIHCYRYGIPCDKGLIIWPAPGLEIEYHRRTIRKRWIVVGTDNPLSKPRVYDQPRDPATGAYISRKHHAP